MSRAGEKRQNCGNAGRQGAKQPTGSHVCRLVMMSAWAVLFADIQGIGGALPPPADQGPIQDTLLDTSVFS